MDIALLRRAFARVRSLVVLICAAATTPAFGQSAILQGGPWAPGHAPMYVGQGTSQPIVQDSGPASGGGPGLGLSELGITARGTGTPPYVGQGTGPFGTNFCDYDAPTTNATGYHFLCFSANAQGGGLITYGAAGAASALPLHVIVNGVTSPAFVVPSTAPTNQFANGLDSSGNLLYAQPTIANLTPIAAGTILGNATGSSASPQALTAIPSGVTMSSADVTFIQAGTGAVATTAQAKMRRTVDLDDYKSAVETDDCAAFQRAHDANNGATIRLPNRQLEMGTLLSSCQINWTNSVRFEGQGWNETAASGTVIHIPNSSLSPFSVSGVAARGSALRNVAITQDQPTPGVGWAPTVYPAVIDMENLLGEFDIENIIAISVYDLAKSYNSGRLFMDKIRGQVFHRVVDIDLALDSPAFSNFHIWPYWSSNVNVLTWQQQNLDVFYLGKVDSPVLSGEMFALGLRSFIHTYTSVNGDASKIVAHSIYCEFCKYALNIESNATAYQYFAQIGTLTWDGQSSASPGTPLADARAIIDTAGNANRMSIGNLLAAYADKYAIESTAVATDIVIGNGLFDFVNQANAGYGAVHATGAGSFVQFGTNPLVINSNNAVLADSGTQVVVSMQSNSVANQVNELRAFGSATGAAPSLNALGSDTNVDLSLTPQGTGALNVNTNTVKLIGSGPAIRWLPSGGTQPANQKNWDVYEDSATGTLNFRALNDAFAAANIWMQVNRSGYAVTNIIFPTTLVFGAYTGYLKGNGGSALSASTTIPSADFADGNTGTGAVAHATSPVFVTPSLGVASATSVNKVAITAPATSATLTLADGSTLATSGAFSTTLTATATTNSTLPAGTHSLAPLDSPSFTTPSLGAASATSLTDTGLSTAGIVTNTAGGLLGTVAYATAADVQAGTDTTKPVTASAISGSAAPQTLTDGATISWNMSLGYNAAVTLGGNRAIATPTNPILGATYTLQLIQDATGGRTITSWPAAFNFGSAGTPTLSVAAGKIDVITLFCINASTPVFTATFAGGF